MTERLTRDRIIELLRQLPADATIDDVIEQLVMLAKIERGIAELDASLGADQMGQGVDEFVEALLRRIASAYVRFERGVPVILRRPGAPILSVEDVDRLAGK